MLCAVDYIFNLLCAINSLQPMKKFVLSVASRATGRLQIKPSGSGDENALHANKLLPARAKHINQRPRKNGHKVNQYKKFYVTHYIRILDKDIDTDLSLG